MSYRLNIQNVKHNISTIKRRYTFHITVWSGTGENIYENAFVARKFERVFSELKIQHLPMDGWMDVALVVCICLFAQRSPFGFYTNSWSDQMLYLLLKEHPFEYSDNRCVFIKVLRGKKHLRWQELIFFCYCLATLIGLVECPEAERFVCDVAFRLFFILSW